MLYRRYRSGFAISFLFFFLIGCANQASEELAENLPPGYSAYSAVINANGPGYVYEYVRAEQGIVESPVCEFLYPERSAVRTSDISLDDNGYSKKFSLDAAVGVLGKFLSKVSPELNAEFSRSVVSRVDWGDLTIEDIPAERRFSEEGRIVRITNRCRAALRERATADGRVSNVYVVFSAIKASSVEIKLTSRLATENESVEGATGAGVGGSMKIRDLVEVRATVTPSSVSDSSLTFSDDRYIGYRSMIVDRFLPLGAFSSPRAQIVGRELSANEIESLKAGILSGEQ